MSRNHHARRALHRCVAALAIVPALAGAAPAEQRHEQSRAFDRTLAVSAGQALRVEGSHGDVRVTAHARPELRVQAAIRVSADSQSAATELLEQIQIEVVEAAASITVRTRYPERSWWRTRRNLSHSVDYTVTMPERMVLNIRNSFGNVAVSGLKADTAIVNSHGLLRASDGTGRQALENSFAPIEVSRITGDVTITGANGNVTAAAISGTLTVTNRFGRVNLGAVKGTAVVANSNGQVDLVDAASANVKNSFGPVNVRDIHGALTVVNSNGSVTAAGVRGVAKVASSFGAIELRDVGADVNVENSNGAVNVATIRGAATVKTSFAAAEITSVSGPLTVTNSNGGVTLRDIGGPVDVRGSFGQIEAEAIKGSIRVTTGNGGVRVADVRGAVTVTTSFGPVELRSVDGKVEVRNQNGAIDASLVARPGACHDVILATTFSPIQVQLPQAGYAVTAQTSFGRIHSDIPITAAGTMSDGRVSGTIGGGGCALQLTNANGDIRIVKQDRTR